MSTREAILPTITTEAITPRLAREMLEQRQPGTASEDSVVALYRQQMHEARWQMNGMPIILSRQGVLLDGLHRLLACAGGSASFPTLVARGVSDAAGHTIDQHRRRSFVDVLSLRGVPHAAQQAALLLRLLRYEKVEPPGWQGLLATLQANPGIEASIHASAAMGGSPLPEPVRSAVLHIGLATDRAGTERLFRALAHPSAFRSGEPGLVLRQALESIQGQLTTRAGQAQAFALAMQALEATLRGESLVTLEAEAAPREPGHAGGRGRAAPGRLSGPAPAGPRTDSPAIGRSAARDDRAHRAPGRRGHALQGASRRARGARACRRHRARHRRWTLGAERAAIVLRRQRPAARRPAPPAGERRGARRDRDCGGARPARGRGHHLRHPGQACAGDRRRHGPLRRSRAGRRHGEHALAPGAA